MLVEKCVRVATSKACEYVFNADWVLASQTLFIWPEPELAAQVLNSDSGKNLFSFDVLSISSPSPARKKT